MAASAIKPFAWRKRGASVKNKSFYLKPFTCICGGSGWSLDFTTTRRSYSVAMMLCCRARHCNANAAAALQWRRNARTPVYLYLGGQNYPGGQN